MYGSNSKARANGDKNVENIALQYKGQVADRLNTEVSVYRNQTEINDISSGDKFEIKSRTSGISNQWTYKLENQLITGGIDYYKDQIKHYLGAGNDRGAEGRSISNTAFYLQDIWNINNVWSLTPGVRIDHNSKFGNHTSPSLVLGYKPNDQTNYYISYKEFFVAPDLYQMYTSYNSDWGQTFGNPNLKPEEGHTIELGVHHAFDDSMSGTFSLYTQHAKNLIAWTSLTDALSTYENTGSIDLWGFNAELVKKFNEHMNASIGYTFAHVDAQSGKNENWNGTLPQSMINTRLNYSNAKLDASIAGRGIMNRKGNKGKNLEKYGNFWVWDVAVNYQVRPYATIFAKVNNVFDQFYSDVVTSGNPYGSGWYSAPGRNYELGVSFQF